MKTNFLPFVLCAVFRSAFALQVATPSFSPAGGVYSSAQSVAITSATSGASIVYTTDGSIPTVSGGAVTHGMLYSGAISIKATTTLSAIAFEHGFPDSGVRIEGYTLQVAVPTIGPIASDFYAITNSPAPSSNVSTLFLTAFSQSPALNVLYNFTFSSSAGDNPTAGLVQGSDGNFYGTTGFGGPGNQGSVFKITPAGVFTTLVLFSGMNGENPAGGLVQGSDGNFYGTTDEGGSGYGSIGGSTLQGDGCVFQMTPAGVLTTLVSFTGANGAIPVAGLVQGSDGNFYGTTQNGGSSNDGTVFKMTPAGVLTTLISFTGVNGATPVARLVQGSDGNFYGTTTFGGSANDGTVFKMTPSGALTTLVSFTGANGNGPEASLVQGSDGNFYGTTTVGSNGTVFKMTPAGALTTLISFTGANGANPLAALVQGSDGNFYGTTQVGGSAGDGTIFKMTPAGVLTTLVSFTGAANGNGPEAALLQGTDGNFYGTTYGGGTTDDGVIFQLIVPPQVAAPAFNPAAGTYTSAQTVTITSTTSGATIRYTTDGSAPTETNGTLYSGPVSISATTTLKAIAYETGFADSSVTSGTYTINIPAPTPTPAPASSYGGGGGGGAPSYGFLGFLAFAGLLRWKLRPTQAHPSRSDF